MQLEHKLDRNGWQYPFVKSFMEGEQYIYIIYILHICFSMYVLWIDSTFWNKCNISMHINSSQKKEEEKKKEGNIFRKW